MRNQSQTIHGLLRQADELDLSVPAAWEMLGQLLDEAKSIQEGVCRALDNARFEETLRRIDGHVEAANATKREYQPIPRAFDQDDFAAAPEGPALHPVFGLLTKQFMAPQQVRR